MDMLYRSRRVRQVDDRLSCSGAMTGGRLSALFIGVSVSALACADPAAAQSNLGGAGLSRAPTLPTMERNISGSLIFGANYSNNIAGGDDAVATVKGLQPGDIQYQPSAQLDLVLPIGPAGIFLNGIAGYDFYQNNKTLQSQRVNLVGGLQGQLGAVHRAV